MCRTPPPPSPTESFNWSDDEDEALPDPKDLLESISTKHTSKGTTCSTYSDKSSLTRASLITNSNRRESNTPGIHFPVTGNSLTEPIIAGGYPSLANAQLEWDGEATTADETESDQVNEPIKSPRTAETTPDQVNEPTKLPRKVTKVVIFTSDEESDTDSRPVIQKAQSPQEEIKKLSAPRVRRRRKSALSSDSSGSEDEYVSAVSTRRNENVVIFTSDEEYPAARGRVMRKKRQPRNNKIGQTLGSRNELADLFAKTSISDIPSKKEVRELIFLTSDDDSSLEVCDKDPQKRWSGRSSGRNPSNLPGSYGDIFSEESELEVTTSDDLSNAKIP